MAARLVLLSLITLMISIGANDAEARTSCYWDGTSPICRGVCPRGFNTVKIQSCFSGYKVLCCEQTGISEDVYGSGKKSKKKKKRRYLE